ncbi:MAG: endo-1,4-beta-xylanase [Paludibacteraceae bacterium]|nr:endo-1,4-beta-xylanase [Paludibacteraceae bacterium]
MKKCLLGAIALLGSLGFSASAQSIIDDDFESGKGDWTSRGGESVAVSKDAALSGSQSLKISSRSSYWNGPSCGSTKLEAGKSYDFEASVYFDGSKFRPSTPVSGGNGLKDIYDKDKYFRIGTCVSGYGITNAATKNMILTHFNSVTPENELKPDATLDQSASQQRGNNVNPQVKLGDGARNILKFCSDNGIPLRGHCFVWHSQTPSWLFKENFSSNGANVSKAIMDQRLENYIKNMFEMLAKEFPNLQIYSYDVVNEAFNEDGTLRTAGDNSMSPGTSYWMQIYQSDEFIINAFTYARKYAPKGCKLYYNDYNEYGQQKRDGIYNIVKKMYAMGIIDGVGMQSHLDVNYPSASLYEQAVEKFSSIGCDVQVTELDVTTTSESSQATYYKNLFDIYKKYKDKISAVVVWGVNDASSWRSSKNPLLFNSSNEPKQCYNAIVEGMTSGSGSGSSSSSSSSETGGLKDYYNKDTYFRFGTCVSGYGITNAATKNMILTHFNSVTPENELKPDATLDQSASQQRGNNVNPQVKLGDGARNILKFCSDNGIPLRGHCFVWHSQTPSWLFKENFSSNGANVSKAIMDQRLENYIKNMFEMLAKEFPNLQIYSYDVVNEAFNEDGTLRTAGDNSMSPGTSYWMQIYQSDEFIINAFTYARKYAPKGCKLYYNDYNEYGQQKRDGIYNIVKKMYAMGIIDGVGMQSHLDVNYPSASLYEQAVEKFSSIGCDVQVTELDVTTTSESSQATYYKNLFNIYKKYKDKISAVVVWGVNDASSWRSSKSPLLFNGSNQPKQCYNAIVEGMSVNGGNTEEGGDDDEEATGLESNPFEICFQYVKDEETVYNTLNRVEVPSKTWTKLSGLVEIPEGATDVRLYLQTQDNGNDADLIDFYIDDAKCTPAETQTVEAVAANGEVLSQNVPNPATNETTIKFTVKEDGFVSIVLYNTLGVKVASIVNEELTAGSYSSTLNVQSLPKGVYVYEMKANGSSSKKAIIVK